MTHVATLVCDPAPLAPDDALLAPVAQRLQAERTEWLTELAADIFFAPLPNFAPADPSISSSSRQCFGGKTPARGPRFDLITHEIVSQRHAMKIIVSL
jgi:hypothetical protein